MILKKGMERNDAGMMYVKRVIPDTQRPSPKRMRPRAKLPMAATTRTAPMVAAETQRLLASHRQKNFTNGLSWKITNLKLSRVGWVTQYTGRKRSVHGVTASETM